jgi:fumarate reductase flavoprotein subunit
MQHIRNGYGVDSAYGSHVWLDIRHLGAKHINTNLREIANICRNFAGIEPVNDLIPVRPTQHYSMGGIRTNIDGMAYGMEGLFALGEAACWDMHGFNRLGGNSLAETIVAGMIVGDKIAQYTKDATLNVSSALIDEHVKAQEDRIQALIERRNGTEYVYDLRREMEMSLSENVGIFRSEDALQTAVDKLHELYQRSLKIGLRSGGRGADPELASALRISGMIRLAYCIAAGALARKESRGSHYREDYPKRDDVNWLKRTLAYWPAGSDKPILEYEPVKITELPPGDRGYGEASSQAGAVLQGGEKK